MKGKIETTIPQRQFENIRTTYYFENDDEKKEAFASAVEDLIVYNGYVDRKLSSPQPEPVVQSKPDQVLKIIERRTVDGVDWRKRKKNNLVIWEYYDKNQTPNRWMLSVTEPI